MLYILISYRMYGVELMPFTTYHMGFALLVGYPLRRWIDWLTFIVSSIIIDLEPFIVVMAGLRYPTHGLAHTFILSIPLGSTVGFILYVFRERYSRLMADLALTDRAYGIGAYISAGILGFSLHTLMDSPLYSEMKPFYPLEFNPMLGIGVLWLPYIYTALYSIGVAVYLIHLYRTSLPGMGMDATRLYVGLISIGLGVITITVIRLYAFLLIITGLLMLFHGLNRLTPNLSRRLTLSLIFLLASTLLLYPTVPSTLSEPILPLFIAGYWTMVSFSILSIAGLILLWPTIRFVKNRSGDRIFSSSLNLLLAGWISAPLLIGLLIAMLAYIAIAIRASDVIRRLFKGGVDHEGSTYIRG